MNLGRGTFGRPVSYAAARWITIGVGLVVLPTVAGVLYATGVDTIEVVAVLLYMPIFVALVLYGAVGGALTALGSAGVYSIIRYPSVHAIGGRDLATLTLSRGVGFLAFGLIGGWASSQLRTSLAKLDRYDEIDDATGLFNARYLVSSVDYEANSSSRYGRVFSVAVVDIEVLPFRQAGTRATAKVLKELGRLVRSTLRNVDRPVHCLDGDRYRFAVILPDTGPEGCRVFASRFERILVSRLTYRHIALQGSDVSVLAVSFPEDADAIQSIVRQFADADLRQTGRRIIAVGEMSDVGI